MLDISKIQEKAVDSGNDYWGDRDIYANGKFTGNLYYYYVDEDLLKLSSKYNNAVPVPPLSAIINVSYMPYINRNDLDLRAVMLDTTRFVGNLGEGGNIIDQTGLLRVKNPHINIEKDLGQIAPFKVERKGGSKYHWSNEGKLWQYPYCYMQISDGLGQEIEVIPYLFNDYGNNKNIKVVSPVNNMGIYSLHIEGYKGITDRLINANVNSSPKSVPITSSPYSDFLSANQAQIAVQQQQYKFNKGVGFASGISQIAQGGASMLSSYANASASETGAGVGVGGAFSIFNGLVDMGKYHVQDMLNTKALIAQQLDKNKVALTAIDTGSDVIFNKFNGNGYLNLYRLRMNDTYMEQVGAFFHMYGYAQNKLMNINLRNRYYFNYIKTSSINIRGQGIPKADLEELKSIYNNGLTIWHIDRANVNVGDYSMDNYEV